MPPVRIIHQTWKTADIPHGIYPAPWQQSWKDLHPGWEYRLWTDEDNDALVRDHYPAFWDAYSSITRGVIRSDVARALYMHHAGGIYADLDFVCLRSFAPLVEELGDFIILGSHAQNAQPLPNAFLYSPPAEPFWLRLVKDALADWSNGQRKPESVAGPDRLKWCHDKYKPASIVLPPSAVYPFAWGYSSQADYAARQDWSSTAALREAYPRSFAVTKWCHNW